MVIVISTNTRVERRHGQVTLRNCCQVPAPSISAASYSSCGMVCRPDSQISMWKTTACQIDSTMIAVSAVLGSFSHAVPCQAPQVMESIKELISPSGWYMNFHRIDTTTIEVTTGMKN